LIERAEAATSQGIDISAELRALRGSYYEDCKFLVDNFARIGIELKSYPGILSAFYLELKRFTCGSAVKFRQMHLKNALRQCNGFIFHRMVSRVSLPQEREKHEMGRSHTSNYDPYSLHGLGGLGYHSHPYHEIYSNGEDSYHSNSYHSETMELSSMSPQVMI